MVKGSVDSERFVDEAWWSFIGVETVCEVVDCCTHCCAHIVVALLQLVTALRPSYIRTDSRTMRTRASSITLCFPRTRFARPIPCDHERSYFQLSPSLHTCPQPARYGIYNCRWYTAKRRNLWETSGFVVRLRQSYHLRTWFKVFTCWRNRHWVIRIASFNCIRIESLLHKFSDKWFCSWNKNDV